MKNRLLALIFLAFLTGCTTQETRRIKQAQLDSYNRQLQANAEERRKLIASLNPEQRLRLEMQDRQIQQQQSMIAWQAQQQQQANRQAAAQNISNAVGEFQNSWQRQQEINAYNARTQAMDRPVNVNVRGTLNHNVNVYGY